MFGVPGCSEVPGAILYCSTWPVRTISTESHVTGKPGNPDLARSSKELESLTFLINIIGLNQTRGCYIYIYVFKV